MSFEYKIKSGIENMNIADIQKLLNQTYWAKGRTVGVIEKSILNSISYGVFLNDKQVGFARAVTDYSTMFWIADVIIDEEHRGRGLGKKIVETITSDKRIEGLLGVLSTEDAHELYENYGFKRNVNFMKKARVKLS